MYAVVSIRDILPDLLKDKLESPIVVENQVGSEVNHTFYVTSNGKPYVVKLMTRPYSSIAEHHRFLKTKMILDLLESKGIPAVKVIHADAELVEIDGTQIHGMLVLEKLEGEPLDVVWEQYTEEQKTSFAKEIARQLRIIHSVDIGSFGLFDPTSDEKNFTSWKEYVVTTSQEAHDKLLEMKIFDEKLLSDALTFITEKVDEFPYLGPASLLHMDLWSGNVIESDGKYFLIDWEWSVAGDPVNDLLWPGELFREDADRLLPLFLEENGIDIENKEYVMKKRYLSVMASLNTCAFGWVFHNPTEEGHRRQEELMRENIYGESG